MELGRLDLSTLSLQEVMRRVATLALSAVPGVDEVSVSLVEGGHARSVVFTGQLALHLDERQYDVDFGPCLTAAREHRLVVVADTADDGTFPEYNRTAHRAGIRSSMSLGTALHDGRSAGLNMYSPVPAAFDDDAAELARAFMGFAAVTLANASTLQARTALAEQLQVALTSRVVIEQAKGALAVRLGCGPEEAFQHLVRESRTSNRKLRDVASEVVASLDQPV